MAESFADRDGQIWLDGNMVPWREAQLHVLSHSLHYAGAVFEGERAYGGNIFRSREHSERLRRSASILDYEIPFSVDQIEDAKREVLEANSLSDAYVRAVAWLAADGMGILSLNHSVRLAVTAYPWGAYYGDARDKGARLDLAEWRRPDPATIPWQAKVSGLYMICTLARNQSSRRGYDDAMMLDYRGLVAESTGANIFFTRGGEVYTPTPDCFLNGITRLTAIDLLEKRNVKVVERHIKPDELGGFEQCFLTGTAAEVTPVVEIGEHSFEIGEMVRTLMGDYDDIVRSG